MKTLWIGALIALSTAAHANTKLYTVEEGALSAFVQRQEMSWSGALPFPMEKVTVQIDGGPGARMFAERAACGEAQTMGAETPTRYGNTWTFVFLCGAYR
ncbi:MAG: hypothetical protein ACU0DW_15165 [Shimia sp.]